MSNIRLYFEKIPAPQFKKKHYGFWNERIFRLILSNKLITDITTKGNKSILDIGCGDLILYKTLIENSMIKSRYFAMDFNLTMLREVKKEYHDIFATKKINLIVADFLECPYKANTFDIIFLLNVTPYINKNSLNDAIDNLYKMIKPNGLLVLTTISKSPFWEAEFDEIKINYHENCDNILRLHNFRIKEQHPIYYFPVEEVPEINIEIAKLYIAGK